jgi:hypothetical protein
MASFTAIIGKEGRRAGHRTAGDLIHLCTHDFI